MLDKLKSIKEKIDQERDARKIYIDSTAVPRYSKGRSVKHRGEHPVYLNQFQRSKKVSEVEKNNDSLLVLNKKKEKDKGKINNWTYNFFKGGGLGLPVYATYDSFGCLNFFGALKTMNIPVVYEGEIEGEFDLEFCCANCAQKSYGWSVKQFSKVFEMAQRGEAIKLPPSVKNETDFKKFVQTL